MILDANAFSASGRRLHDYLCQEVIGSENKNSSHERAIMRIVRAYERRLSPIWQEKEPILLALHTGASGVGKSLLAKKLASFFFDNEAAITRIEGERMTESHLVSQLISTSAGYIGYDDEPLLSQGSIDRHALKTLRRRLVKSDLKARELNHNMKRLAREALGASEEDEGMMTIPAFIRAKRELEKYIRKSQLVLSIILFDEFEKAHHKVQDIFLSIKQEGKITLLNNTTTKFYNSFIILTANCGAKEISKTLSGKRLGFAGNAKKEIYKVAMSEIKKDFKPELLGRIKEDITVFEQLTAASLGRIFDLQFRDLIVRLYDRYPLDVTIDETVKGMLVESALEHPQYGARPLINNFRDYVRSPIDTFIAAEQVKEGDSIFVTLDENKKIIHRHNETLGNNVFTSLYSK